MDIFEFIERFPGEKECVSYFIETRQKVGIFCQKCNNDEHIWLADIDRFECTKCGNRIGIKSGTLMENSQLPIKYWFIAIQLLTSASDNFSIAEIQEKISCAEQNEILEMLEILKAHLDKLKNGQSFDQLLLACVVNQGQIPESKTDKQNNIISNAPSINPTYFLLTNKIKTINK
ncbi:MAG: hypothetical protein WC384_13955 [Prolixibacteraceae bacterium]|jgi:hypothetical protein